jgi:hypothetical protein
MVLPLIVACTDEERTLERLFVPVVLRLVSAQALIAEVAQVIVVVSPLRTRLGLAVRLLMTPASTQVEPPATWT